MATISLVPEHGYVASVVAASYFLHHMYMNYGVMMARKAFNVKYPALYATP
jgi:glutathione S-transferase